MTIIQLADPELFEGKPCTTTDAERFFVEGRYAGDPIYDDAKAECARCDVRKECLKIALREEGTSVGSLRWGVYGGLDSHERARLAAAQ